MNFFYVFILFIFFQSCAPSFRVVRIFDPISNIKVNERANNLEVYYEGEQINFEYERIGIVNVRLSQAVDRSHLISHLKYEAWKNGANTIIAVKIGDIALVSGGKHVSTEYLPAISGIAVRKLVNKEQLALIDTSFISIVKLDQKRQEKSEKDAINGAGCLVVVLISLMVIPFLVIFS